MAAWHVWLRTLGAAIWEEAPRAVVGLIPFGDNMARIAENFWLKLRSAQPPGQDKAALEGLANATPTELRAEAALAAAAAAPGAAPEDVAKLAGALELAAPATRRVMARAEDPSGKTVPSSLRLDGPAAVARFIPHAPPRFQAGQKFNGWVMKERLGAGGFAEVWRICHPHDEELSAAVKFFFGDQARGRLGQHEVSVLRQVRRVGAGAGIVQLQDFDVDADPPWIRFEYVAGGDLLHHARHFFGLKATQLVRKLAETVGAFHRLTPAVVHRDLKPGNILMLRVEGGKLRPVIADFGIGGVSSAMALEAGKATTRATAALPTILAGSHTGLYASPQQAAGEGADPRDDVYALGVLWYQLIIGDLSSPAPSGLWTDELAEIGVPTPLIKVLGACVEPKKVDRRPRDAAELAERISAATAPAAAPPKPEPPVAVPVVPVPPKLELPPARPTGLTVSSSGDGTHRTIADAIRAASHGMEIRVRPGVYRECVVLDKNVRLIADGRAVIECDSTNALRMATDEATVRGLTIRCTAGKNGHKVYGIDIPRGRLTLDGCDITSDSLACVAVHGKDADPVIRDCRVHDGQAGGIYIYDNARGLVEGCEIYASRLAGVSIAKGADPSVRRCKIHGSQEGGGVYAYEGGRGSVEGCDIYANKMAGIEIKDSDLAVRNCTIRDSKDGGGVFANVQARGTVEDCDISGNKLAGVEVRNSDPVFRRCKVRNGQAGGIYVHDQGKGTFEGCEVSGNKLVGVEIKGGSAPVLRDCEIHGGEGSGVYVHDKGRGTIEGCDIHDNRLAGVSITKGGDPSIRDCKLHGSREGGGVYSYDGGRGSVEDCDIYANKLSGVEIKDADLSMRKCTIRESKDGGGIFANKCGRGLIEECDISANKLAGVEIKDGADPVFRRCKIRDSREGSAVYVHDGGKGTFEDCELRGNKRGGFDIGAGCTVTRRNNKE